MMRSKGKDISNRNGGYLALSQPSSPTTASPGHPITSEKKDSLLMIMIEYFTKDINNSLKEIQENTGKQLEALKELQENTTKQVKELNQTIQDLKMEIEALKKLQRETTLEIENVRKRSGAVLVRVSTPAQTS